MLRARTLACQCLPEQQGAGHAKGQATMTDESNPPPAGDPGEPGQPAQPGPDQTLQRFSPVSARVPERVARGVLSTGQVILDGPKEFIIDFLQGLTRPQQITARVVMTPQTVHEFIQALRQNVENYTRQFGPIPVLPPPTTPKPTLQELYDNFKLSDDMMSGQYANAVLIGHSITEFFFDFITTFFPTSAVSARVYISVPIVPRFLSSLENAMRQWQKRFPPKGPRGDRPSDEPLG